MFRLLKEKTGENIRLRIRRDGERDLEPIVGSVEIVTYRIADGGSPTLEQVKIRESWLRR